jgi:NAD(P)-dependent dehydrogenase (short-subunit alcohol dehydrogenase family)
VAESAPFLRTPPELLGAALAGQRHGRGGGDAGRPARHDRGRLRPRGAHRLDRRAQGYPYVTAYAATKHALLGLVRSLAQEVAAKGVTVNAVCPGFTDTDIVAESVARIMARTGRTEAEARAELAKHNPQRRLVQPAEVAAAVLMLCAPGAAAINGQAVAVDGGET